MVLMMVAIAALAELLICQQKCIFHVLYLHCGCAHEQADPHFGFRLDADLP